jgi:zinc transporter, ZIP family
MLEAGAWALLAAASLVVGSLIAQRVDVSPRVIGMALGFGGGALLGALAYELIPAPNVSDWLIWTSFGAGALVFYVADGALERHGAGDGDGDGDGAAAGGASAGTALALGALLDGVPESLVLGMSVAVGGEVSFGFLLAVFVSNVPESLSATADMRPYHSDAWISRLWVSIAGISAISGAVGYFVADHLTGADGRYVQAFAAGAVLTMVSSSMMPEAFKEGGRVVSLLSALGFAVAAVLTLLE